MSVVEETPSSEQQQTTNEEQTTEEQKALVNQDQKPEMKPEEKPEPVVVEPVTADALKIPEGLTIPDENKTEFLEILNGDLSPSDRANALIALQAKVMEKAQETDSTAWTKMQEDWQGEVKSDPDVGGAKLQPTLTNIGKLIDEYGSSELRDVFDLTGAGNNVHVIKFLNKIAGKLTEGGHEVGKPVQAVDTEAAKAARMFPSMKG